MLNSIQMTSYQAEQFRIDNDYHIASDIIQSIQQSEWEVEIEMDDSCYVGTCSEADYMVCINGCVNKEPTPKLDAEGCLILKRI